MNDPYLTYQDCAGYFRPPISTRTVYEWLKEAKAKVFKPTKNKVGNATVRIRKSVWESILSRNEKRITARKTVKKSS
jgi:hypothetical protein